MQNLAWRERLALRDVRADRLAGCLRDTDHNDSSDQYGERDCDHCGQAWLALWSMWRPYEPYTCPQCSPLDAEIRELAELKAFGESSIMTRADTNSGWRVRP